MKGALECLCFSEELLSVFRIGLLPPSLENRRLECTAASAGRITGMTSGISIELQAELSLSSCYAVTEAGRFATPHL